MLIGILRKAYRDITRRKLRSLLTAVGIAIGVASMVAVVSTMQNLRRAQADAFANTSQADLTYWVWDAPPGLRRSLEALPNVAAVEMRNTYFTKALLDGQWRDIWFIGIEDFGAMSVNVIKLLEGRYPGPDEVLLEVSSKEVASVVIGQEIAYRSGPEYAERTLIISGFAWSPTYPSAVFTNLILAYVPATKVRQMLGISGSNQLLIKLVDVAQRERTMSAIAHILEHRGIQYDTPIIRDPEHFIGKRELESLGLLLLLFSGVGLVVSGFLSANTLAAIVTEQVSEIGVMKAVGATRARILQFYLLIALFYGFGGTAIGLLLGTVGGWFLLDWVGHTLNMPISLWPSTAALLLGISVGTLITVLAGLVPALQGAGISVKEALSSYGLTSTYGQSMLDRWLQRLRILPPLVAMSVRNLARRKARNIVTILFIAIAAAALLAAQSVRQSVEQAIDQIFDTYHADAWVWFEEWVGTSFATSLKAIPQVVEAEAWHFTNGWVALDRVRVWGLPEGSKLYQPQLVSGRWFKIGEFNAAVVSSELAASRGIHPGDVITVELSGGQREFRVIGIVVDNSIFLGSTVAGKVFIPVRTMERMRGILHWASFFALQFDEHSPVYVDKALADIERKFRHLRPGTEAAYRDMEGAMKQTRLLSIALYMVTLLIALAGGIGMLNTLTLNIVERRREIGVLRAIGAGNVSLVQIFMAEGLTMGLLGWVLSIMLGYPLGLLFVHVLGGVLFQIAFVFPPSFLLLSFGFCLVLSITASLVPALGAARLPAQQALRYE